MRYVGGKSKIAQHLAAEMLAASEGRVVYWEPFVGGGSMLPHMAPFFRQTVASDISDDLILMWQALQRGWMPPEVVTVEEYNELRTAPPSALRGLVGFGGSFGGKWFGGYARGGFDSKGNPRNHQWESARAAMRIRDAIASSPVTFERRHYQTIQPQWGDVVYCDPPYAETQGYGAAGEFDSAAFWETAERWSELGATVFVSEYSAPEGWESVWSANKRQSLVRPDQGRDIRVEHLFRKVGV